MAVAQEFETRAIPPQQLQQARKFAASYAGEHVAGVNRRCNYGNCLLSLCVYQAAFHLLASWV